MRRGNEGGVTGLGVRQVHSLCFTFLSGQGVWNVPTNVSKRALQHFSLQHTGEWAELCQC